jgi:RimJ/RimL family protein N-acetyltransferase
MRVLEKNGYEKDDLFKKSNFKNGQTCDEYRFSITR